MKRAYKIHKARGYRLRVQYSSASWFRKHHTCPCGRLGVVAAQFGMTAAALRTEAKRGRLVISRVAGKDWTSVAEVQRMFGLRRVDPEAPTFGSGHEQCDIMRFRHRPRGCESSPTEASPGLRGRLALFGVGAGRRSAREQCDTMRFRHRARESSRKNEEAAGAIRL